MCLVRHDLLDRYHTGTVIGDLVTSRQLSVYEGVNRQVHWIPQTFACIFVLTVIKIFKYYCFIALTADVLTAVGSVVFAPLQINIRFDRELIF